MMDLKNGTVIKPDGYNKVMRALCFNFLGGLENCCSGITDISVSSNTLIVGKRVLSLLAVFSLKQLNKYKSWYRQ